MLHEGSGLFDGLSARKFNYEWFASCRRAWRRQAINVLIGAVVSALLLGYLAGLLSFKVKDRWCPDCGATTTDLSRQRAGRAR